MSYCSVASWFCFLVLACSGSLPAAEPETQQAVFREELAQQILAVDASEFSDRDTISLCLEASGAFHEAGMAERSQEYFQRAMDVAQADFKRHQFSLFRHALKVGDLAAAQRIADKSTARDNFLDRIAVEKYRRGDDSALEGFPHDELNFHSALDLTDAYTKRGEYDKLEDFVTGIKSLPSNEPTDVGAIAWERVAREYRKQGDMEKAREFIDKAKQIGGNNYYTGYGVRVAHLAMHGGLEEQAEKYARRAVAYGSHFTRELLGQLIGDLVAAGHYGLARKTLDYYPTQEERVSGDRYLALHMAEQQQFEEAIQMARAIEDNSKAASARKFVAAQLMEARQREQARKLLFEAVELLFELDGSSPEHQRRDIVRMLARLGERDKVMEVIADANTPLDQGRRAAAALEGAAT